MIESTFCHLPNITLEEEKYLWRKGVRHWDDLLCWAAVYACDDRYRDLDEAITRSRRAIASQNASFFLHRLPPPEQYRIYPDFAQQFFFLDIETAGLNQDAEITCLSILNGKNVQSFLCTENFNSAGRQLSQIQIVVTFHGTHFDIPRLIRRFPNFSPRFHVDLAKTLKFHKINGSLKEVVHRFGWKSDGETSVITNGKEAAEAWRSYHQSIDSSIIKDLIIYNQTDVKMLKFLIRALVSHHARLVYL